MDRLLFSNMISVSFFSSAWRGMMRWRPLGRRCSYAILVRLQGESSLASTLMRPTINNAFSFLIYCLLISADSNVPILCQHLAHVRLYLEQSLTVLQFAAYLRRHAYSMILSDENLRGEAKEQSIEGRDGREAETKPNQ